MSNFDNIKKFSNIINRPFGSITLKDSADLNRRARLISEEYCELMQAMGFDVLVNVTNVKAVFNKSLYGVPEPDEVHVLKELCDLEYVTLGTAVELGYQFDEAALRVHNSNMTKVNEHGNVELDNSGKVIKGANYKAPMLDDLV